MALADGVEIAVEGAEVDQAAGHRGRRGDARLDGVLPFRGAGGAVDGIERSPGAADVDRVAVNGGRGNHLALGLECPFDAAEFGHSGGVIDSGVLGIAAKTGAVGRQGRNRGKRKDGQSCDAGIADGSCGSGTVLSAQIERKMAGRVMHATTLPAASPGRRLICDSRDVRRIQADQKQGTGNRE